MNEQTGEYVLLADRWHTCFFDLDGKQGLLGQVQGRTADDAAYWLAQAAPAWRDRIEVVAIDMCTIYLAAVRRMLPQAQAAVDLFHVVQLAVKTAGDVRRRAVRGKYGRRGRSGDPEYGIKGLLVRNLEHLSPAQFAKVIGRPRRSDPAGQEIAAAWIGKEKLRDVLNLRARVTGSVPCRARRPRPAVRVLRLVRAERRHPRADQPGQDDIPVGRRDRLRGLDRGDERVGFILRLSLVLMQLFLCDGTVPGARRWFLLLLVIVARGSDIRDAFTGWPAALRVRARLLRLVRR